MPLNQRGLAESHRWLDAKAAPNAKFLPSHDLRVPDGLPAGAR